MKMLIKRALKILSILGITGMVLLAAVLAGPCILRLKPYAVLSGSMEPVYPTGSLIYVKSTQPDQIKTGMPITFTRGEMIVTHRVVQIDTEKRVYYTKGDANSIWDDGSVPFQNLLGKPVFDVPYLGYAAVYISGMSGKIVLVFVFLCLLIITILSDILAGKRHVSHNKKRILKRKENSIE